jgi:hypothetical protein
MLSIVSSGIGITLVCPDVLDGFGSLFFWANAWPDEELRMSETKRIETTAAAPLTNADRPDGFSMWRFFVMESVERLAHDSTTTRRRRDTRKSSLCIGESYRLCQAPPVIAKGRELKTDERRAARPHPEIPPIVRFLLRSPGAAQLRFIQGFR